MFDHVNVAITLITALKLLGKSTFKFLWIMFSKDFTVLQLSGSLFTLSHILQYGESIAMVQNIF